MNKRFLNSRIPILTISTLLIAFLLITGCQSKGSTSANNDSFEKWVQAELASGKSTIVIPKGVHHAYPSNVNSKTMHLSNNDDGLKNILFDLSYRKDLVIDGNGAELILHGHIIPFFMENAKNITIKNLTIDWEHPFFGQGEITEVGQGYFNVQFSNKYPAAVKYERLVFINPDLPEAMGFNNINIVNPDLGRLVYKSMDEYGVAVEHKAEKIAENLFRISSKNIRSPLKVGHIAVFQYEHRSSPAIVAHGSKDIHLTNITEYHAAGIANLFEGSSNIYIDSMQMVRRPGSGRWFTSHHDATHFVDCRGDIHLRNSKFEFQGDDDCNIHGVFRPVVRKNGTQDIVITLRHFQQIGIKTLFAGDNVGFYDAKTLELLGEGKLKKVVQRVAQESILTFEDKLPELRWDEIVVALREHNVDVQIVGNHFSNHRARSLLLKTLGKIRVHDNYFHVQGAAIKIRSEASSWYEAGPVEDVEIYNNVFDQCNNGGFSNATFELHCTLKEQDSEVSVHKNIKIYNNKIYQIFKPLMIVDHVENLEFYNNEIVKGTDYKPWFKGKREPDNIKYGKGVVNAKIKNDK